MSPEIELDLFRPFEFVSYIHILNSTLPNKSEPSFFDLIVEGFSLTLPLLVIDYFIVLPVELLQSHGNE